MTEVRLALKAAAYLRSFDARLLDTTEGRRILTRLNPRLFAMVYLRHHLSGAETGGLVSFSEAHLDWYDQMLGWVKPTTTPKRWRRSYVAPRNSAKSTTWFLTAPLWAAAHGHVRFVAAFADSATQAEQHLATFKHELETNELLRKDFPDLCRAATRARGQVTSDNRALMQQRNGFVFAARGVDSANLGLKIGERRPDLLIFDDIEPDASNYSAALVEKRLATVQNALLPLNDWARVVLVGTVTMPGSLIHQLVQTVTTTAEPAQWIADEKFTCHYYPALISEDDGTERSLWPERWPVGYLLEQRHTRSFALNMMNQPVAQDGLMWSASDITVADPGSVVLNRCRHLISVDPAVTKKKSSDNTGLAVLSHDRATNKVYVRDVRKVRLTGVPLRHYVASLLEQYPEVSTIFCEVNQGGDLWEDVFGDLGVRYVTVHQSVNKEVRAGWLLNGYQSHKIEHVVGLPDYDAELLAFPNGLHDDQIDAVGSGFIALTGAGQSKAEPMRARVA